MNMFEVPTSTHDNVNDVVGGRKAEDSVAGTYAPEEAVLVSLSRDDAIVFSDDPEVVSLESDEDDGEEEETEEEEEEEWMSDEESEEEDEEDAELDEGLAERLRILADARALKSLAVAFLHPERPVEATDPAVYGRNFFERPSAPERQTDEDADEEVDILEDAIALKKAAMAYLHPEVGVKESAPECFGRNFFERPSAPEVEDAEDAEERAHVLAEAAALKRSAVDYMHPEIGVATADGACFGRNYFNRPSAPETEANELADERAEILAEAATLKKLAVDYMHPEVGVTAVDGACFGRNYFERFSAPDTEDVEEAEERARVLADAAALKKSAIDYMHPEVGVTSTDGACFGRNYFNRASAPETEEDEFADERAEILAEAVALKKLAVDYMHPEIGVKATDGTCLGRNYYTRPSAPDIDDAEDAVPYVEVGDARVWLANERARILEEAAALKKSAVAYLHPEVVVTTADGTCFGRNYFNRASAPETEEDEFADERAEILEEAAALKKLAMDYMHPEVGVTSTDGTCFGRNYFNRPSAPQTEEDELADERAEILAEAAALKNLAVAYMHPEVGVHASDATVFGRNYFNRPSAPETEDAEEAEERARVLAEAAAFKKSAADYMHPEVRVTSADGACFGRNYFNRSSAHETEDNEFADERARVLVESAALKKSAVDYMHPEDGVTTTDPTVFGRNYFSRYSAPGAEPPKKAKTQTESPEESQAVASVKTLAAAVKGANLSSTKFSKLSSSNKDVGAKKSESSVNLFGLSEEVV